MGGIKENPFGDDPFQEFTTALEEGDGSVCLRVKASTGLDSTTCTKSELVAST